MAVAIPGISRLQDAHDLNVTLGAGVDGYALTWDNATSKFIAHRDVGRNGATGIKTVYCVGDSLTAASYPRSLEILLGAAWRVTNCGHSGHTSTQILALFDADVIDPGDAQYIIILAGINDIPADISAAAIEANLQAMYTAAAAEGATVVAVTLLPYKGSAGWTAGRQIVIDAVNTWILNTATDVDYRIDAYSALEDPSVADTLLPANDSGDHLHLSATGYTLLATTIRNGVTWAVARGNTFSIANTAIGLNQSLLTTSTPQFAGVITPAVKPLTDSTTGVQIANANGVAVLNVDTTNARVGIGTTAPDCTFHVVEGTFAIKSQGSGVAGLCLFPPNASSPFVIYRRGSTSAQAFNFSIDASDNSAFVTNNASLMFYATDVLFDYNGGGTDWGQIRFGGITNYQYPLAIYPTSANSSRAITITRAGSTTINCAEFLVTGDDLYLYMNNANFYVSAKAMTVGVVGSASAKLHVDQSSSTGAIPVLLLDQGDDSENMIEFTGTVGVGNCIEAVGSKTLTTTHFIKVTITGVGERYIPVGTIA